MKRMDDHFILHRSRSGLFSKHRSGDVPYITNGFSDNGVMGFVSPLKEDRVFRFRGIAVSAFCEATMQIPPFIGYGCAGTGITALEPRYPMSVEQLAYAAAYINLALRWRFSWYWRSTASRLGRLSMPETLDTDLTFNVRELMPPVNLQSPNGTGDNLVFRRFALGEIFTLQPGTYHSFGTLPRGLTPMISCGDEENGVCGYFDVRKVHSHRMTIAFNGATLAAKYHPYVFAAKDDVAVCIPKYSMRMTTLLFIKVMLKREQWRFSYYRKCYKEKLDRVTLPLPSKSDGSIDEDRIESIMGGTPYSAFIHDRLQ
ncbi:MAG TPA: hypothetical protein VFA90_02000 [Terriglobales bacterium]|nr:hypothetical protein [Terriglobales bacterium]